MSLKYISRDLEIETVLEIIEKRNEYRENSEHGLVILVNGQWGSGKTYFLRKLKERCKDIYNILSDYNAWENEIFDSPGLPIFSNIIGDESLIGEINNIVNAKIKNNKKSLIQKFGNDEYESRSLVYRLYEFYDVKETVKRKIQSMCNAPSVFMIDELDRCNPKFVIETLEIVKHFFDVENCIFIIAVDKEQLGESIKTVFGQNMDVDLYFSKFFDYQFDLPKINYNELIDMTSLDIKFNYLHETLVFINALFQNLSISIRDCNKIINVFKTKANKDWTLAQIKVILFLLTLKYTDLYLLKEFYNSNMLKYIELQLNKGNLAMSKYHSFLYVYNKYEISNIISKISNRLDYVYEDCDTWNSKDNWVTPDSVRVTQELFEYVPYVGHNLTFRETLEKILN